MCWEVGGCTRGHLRTPPGRSGRVESRGRQFRQRSHRRLHTTTTDWGFDPINFNDGLGHMNGRLKPCDQWAESPADWFGSSVTSLHLVLCSSAHSSVCSYTFSSMFHLLLVCLYLWFNLLFNLLHLSYVLRRKFWTFRSRCVITFSVKPWSGHILIFITKVEHCGTQIRMSTGSFTLIFSNTCVR